MKQLLSAACLTAIAVVLVGCSAEQPTYNEVRDEATDAMQLIVDALPEGLGFEDKSGEPFACTVGGDTLLSGDGQFYTGIWVAYPDGEFDGQALIEELPSKLGDDFVVDDTALEVSYPVVALKPTAAPDVLIDVTASTPSEDPFIEIRAISRCGATPTP